MPATSKNQAIVDAARLSENAVSCDDGCDEYEKMISGMYFTISKCRKLQEHRLKTRNQLQDFNDESITDNCTLESMKSRRMKIAKQMLGKLGEHVEIEAPFFCGWGSNIFIGDSVYMNRNVSIFDNSLVQIGNYVRIEPDVTICTDTHEVDPVIRIERGTSFACPIVIEDHCWIGARATILPGVRVGRGSTVAAGAVVSKDVEDSTVVGGVPAKVIKKLSNEPPTSSKGFS